MYHLDNYVCKYSYTFKSICIQICQHFPSWIIEFIYYKQQLLSAQ